MAHFLADTNNGVTALITREDAERLKNNEKLEYGIFLFTYDGMLDWPVHGQPWFHGDVGMMNTLLEGHFVDHSSSFGGVPFSNGATLYSDRETLLSEITKIAPMHKLLEAFGVELRHTVAVS